MYSHGDLAANYKGMIFWRNLTTKYYATKNPYIKCIDEQFVLVRTFDWRDYVDQAWDEGINCNKYKNSSIQKKVWGKQITLEKELNKIMTCPVKQLLCTGDFSSYAPYQKYIISPKCHEF